jgi:hypothetical protein
MLWQLRPPKPEDLSFIYNSWLKSMRDGPAFANLTHTVFYKELHDRMEAVLKTTQVVIACAPGEDDIIYGYGLGEPIGDLLAIHYLYVKHSFRAFGIGKALEAELLKIPHSEVAFSSWTKGTKSLLKERKYQYNPWLLWARK